MNKKCVKCGHPLPEHAAFCPHCTALQTEKKEIKAPRRWKKKALAILGILILFAMSEFAFSACRKPKTYEGGAQIVYRDKDRAYRVLLNFSDVDGMAGNAVEKQEETLPEGMDSALPCQLYVLDEESGKLAWENFTAGVESCKIEIKPHENARKAEYTEPVHSESFPNAAYMSSIHYVSDCGTNDIQWTVSMKNGDTILLHTQLTVEKKIAVTYAPEDTPMETTNELNALLESIEAEVPSDTPVYLYLPAVTYDGAITFGDHIWNIYGSTEGSSSTTFTGTVSMKGLNGNYACMFGILFEGKAGTGVDASCFVNFFDCGFDGWDTAALARDGGWVGASNCTFTDNTTALKFQSSFSYGTNPTYADNTFTGNGTAVCIERLAGSEVLDFTGSVFSGNEVDIDNPAEHPINTENAVFR